MKWPWRKRLEEARAAVEKAEELRNGAVEQRRRVEEITPRVDAAAASLRQLRTDNHFGPLMDSILRGSK